LGKNVGADQQSCAASSRLLSADARSCRYHDESKAAARSEFALQVGAFMCMLKGLEPALRTRVERQQILVPALSSFTLGERNGIDEQAFRRPYP
jgi:hypothetical protein